MFAQDHETDALLREATQWSDAKDWDRAIACLRQANARMKVSPVSYPVQTWLRLPLYLQKAERFDEAMIEFTKLADETGGRIARAFPHQSKAKQQVFAKQELAVIQDKIRLAKEREAKLQAKNKKPALSKPD